MFRVTQMETGATGKHSEHRWRNWLTCAGCQSHAVVFVAAMVVLALEGVGLRYVENGVTGAALCLMRMAAAVAAGMGAWWLIRRCRSSALCTASLCGSILSLVLGIVLASFGGFSIRISGYVGMAVSAAAVLAVMAAATYGAAMREIAFTKESTSAANSVVVKTEEPLLGRIWAPFMAGALTILCAVSACYAFNGRAAMVILAFVVACIILWKRLTHGVHLLLVAVGVSGVAVLACTNIRGLEMWFNAFSDPYAYGYVWFTFLRVLSQGLFPRGVVPGAYWPLVPMGTTEFVLAEVADTLGVLGLVSSLLLAAMGLYSGVMAAVGEHGQRHDIALGFTSLMAASALLNTLKVFHIVPFFALSFPMLSDSVYAQFLVPFMATVVAMILFARTDSKLSASNESKCDNSEAERPAP